MYRAMWHPATLIKERGCVDMPMDTMYLIYPLVLFDSEGSALTLTLFLLSHRIIMLCNCSSTTTKDHSLLISYGTKCFVCRCAFKHLFIHSCMYARVFVNMCMYVCMYVCICMHFCMCMNVCV